MHTYNRIKFYVTPDSRIVIDLPLTLITNNGAAVFADRDHPKNEGGDYSDQSEPG